MNTVGKILVILNLVFALATGGFLVIDFATRTNWKNSYDQLKREMDVVKLNTDATGGTAASLADQATKLAARVETLQQDLQDARKTAQVEIDNLKLQRDEAVEKIAQADLNAKATQAENLRLKDEVKGLSGTIAKREQYIAGLQDDNKKLRTEAINQTNMAKSAQDRSEVILAQYQDALKKLARHEAGVNIDTGGVKDPNQPNFPPSYVKGKIESVDPNGLVTVSVGSDQGVQKNHTLEVYRMTPRPEYLGMIRILDAGHHQAIGRLMSSSVSGARRALREGDVVSSSISQP